MRVALACFFFVVVIAVSAPARACAACGCGTNAPLPVGIEQPFSGRVRTAAVLTTSSTTQEALGRDDVVGATLALAVSVALSERLVIDVAVPIAARFSLHDGALQGRGFGLSDVAAGLRIVGSDNTLRPRFTGSLRVGLLAPTTTLLRDDDGYLLSAAVQPGNAELGLQLTGSLAWMASPVWTFIAMASAGLPVWSASPIGSGSVAELRVFGLARATDQVSVRAGVAVWGISDSRRDARLRDDGRVSLAPEVGLIFEPVVDVSASVVVAATLPSWGKSTADGPRVTFVLAKDW